jgi:acyl-CoA synthetase (AMP-forming)/AMP-acid ligase II
VTTTSELGPHHPARWAERQPDAVALSVRAAPGRDGVRDTVTYRELAARSAQLARALRRRGLGVGDGLVVLCTTRTEMIVSAWAALRSGLYCTPVSTGLTADECAHLVADTGASALVASAELESRAAVIADRCALTARIAVDGRIERFEDWSDVLAAEPSGLLDAEIEGSMMFYSSGTTGRPKGVRRPLSGAAAGTANPLAPFVPHCGLGAETVYLSPAPLYHAAPLGWSLGTLRLGGQVVLLTHFEPELVLGAIAAHRVTIAQLVPTMLARILHLDPAVRDRHDRSSLEVVLHAAAPCPPRVKRAAIEWFGPIVHEYYSGTEGSGITYITAPEWLAHPGSVGRPILGRVHVTDEDGAPLPPLEDGIVWFDGGEVYEYHGDSRATAARRDPRGWTTLDDIGHVDEDGYLYLTDRRGHMIVSGGVNVSPHEVEDVLSAHPAVDDVAVIGVPNDDLGEEVKAVVVVSAGASADRRALERDLIAHCRRELAAFKCPRSVDVVDELPRLPTGKLEVRRLRDRYWSGHDTRIV